MIDFRTSIACVKGLLRELIEEFSLKLKGTLYYLLCNTIAATSAPLSCAANAQGLTFNAFGVCDHSAFSACILTTEWDVNVDSFCNATISPVGYGVSSLHHFPWTSGGWLITKSSRHRHDRWLRIKRYHITFSYAIAGLQPYY